MNELEAKPGEKVCQDCGEEKSISQFPRNIVQPDGFLFGATPAPQSLAQARAFFVKCAVMGEETWRPFLL
ncbi:hypothetical protein GCM10023238_05050 [Streptomyces heliomycini]